MILYHTSPSLDRVPDARPGVVINNAQVLIQHIIREYTRTKNFPHVNQEHYLPHTAPVGPIQRRIGPNQILGALFDRGTMRGEVHEYEERRCHSRIFLLERRISNEGLRIEKRQHLFWNWWHCRRDGRN